MLPLFPPVIPAEFQPNSSHQACRLPATSLAESVSGTPKIASHFHAAGVRSILYRDPTYSASIIFTITHLGTLVVKSVHILYETSHLSQPLQPSGYSARHLLDLSDSVSVKQELLLSIQAELISRPRHCAGFFMPVSLAF